MLAAPAAPAPAAGGWAQGFGLQLVLLFHGFSVTNSGPSAAGEFTAECRTPPAALQPLCSSQPPVLEVGALSSAVFP